MITQLIILTSGTIYATSGTIDLYDDIPMSLNYNIADIKEPQKRNTDYSKTITIPGSNNNNKLLSHIYEIGIDRLFNPNHKTEARILYGGIQVFKGYMRLNKIRKLRDEKIEYDIELRGRLDDLFTNLINLKLTELNWTDLDHILNRTNIINSWSAPAGSNYVYPFIDYGYEANPNNINVNYMFPAVYIKEAWDRIFRTAGFQYSSTFLTSDFFKHLIMPFTADNLRLTTTQIQTREFQASRLNTNQTHIPFSTSGTYQLFTNIFNDDTTSPNIDSGNNYNISTGIYTVPANGHYNFVANLSFDGLATPHLANQYINYYIYGVPRILINGIAKSYGKYFGLNFPTTQISVATASTDVLPYTNQYITFSLLLTAGDTVSVDFQALLNASTNPALASKPIGNVDYQIRLNTGSYFYAQVDPIIKNGDTVTFSNSLPSEMMVTDFLVSIIKMFNLYFEYDKNIPNKIYIEPRNDYYNNTIQDWTNKLDSSKEPEIIPMGALNAKTYQFTYKQDMDMLNDIYYKTYGEVYGEKRYVIDNDFLKNTEKMEIIFSPSPQYNVIGTGKAYPALYNIDSNLKIVHNKGINPRILYYGGLKNCTPWYLYTLTNNNFTYYTELTTYPYCGMMDDPDSPTISLDFESPYEVHYTPTWNASYSNNNLFNKYWKQFIEEITDYNSSIITAWFWLKPVDIMEVDFRNVYRFLGQNFRLNKIYDYNPTEESLTKCEFIKIKNGIPFVPTSHYIRGGSQPNLGIGTNSNRQPAPPKSTSQGNNINIISGTISNIIGSNNYISPTATGVTIQGNGNSIGTGANNISILNSSGCIVAGGLVNVQIFNSSGVTVTTSNTIVQNNVVTYTPTQTTEQFVNKIRLTSTSTPIGIAADQEVAAVEFYYNDDSINAPIVGTKIQASTPTGWAGANSNFSADLRFLFSNSLSVPATEQIRMTGDGRLYGKSLHNNSGSITGITNQYIASGTYTPTLTNINNISASTAYQCQFIRLGNVVTVSGGFSATTTALVNTNIQISLPIAVPSTFLNFYDLGGMGGITNGGMPITFYGNNNGGGIAIADGFWNATPTEGNNYTFSFTYLIY